MEGTEPAGCADTGQKKSLVCAEYQVALEMHLELCYTLLLDNVRAWHLLMLQQQHTGPPSSGGDKLQPRGLPVLPAGPIH